MRRFSYLALWLVCLLAACTRPPLKEAKRALRPVAAPRLADDLGVGLLGANLEEHSAFLAQLPPESVLRFAERTIPLKDYRQGLDYLIELAKSGLSEDEFYRKVEESFEFYEVYGGDRWGEVRLTSYYEAQLEGSATKTEAFSTPLLSRPDDLIEVAASKYDDRLNDVGTLRGRLIKDKDRKRDVLMPYYTRAEIDAGALKAKKLELCWVNPIDAFFMQIQGSGTVQLPNEKMLRLGYSDQNGHQYHSIGRFLKDIIPLEKMSMFTIESHLRSLPAAKVKTILDKNPSYVFFRQLEGPPITSMGNRVFAGRTIATDTRYFPKGALGFMRFKKPVFDSPEALEPTEWEESARFVFDQDTGGAIRGGGRVDLFWGSGPEAKRYAGFLKDKARLYYLAPREQWLEAQAQAGRPSSSVAPAPPLTKPVPL